MQCHWNLFLVKDMHSQTIKTDQMFPESIQGSIFHQRFTKLIPNTNCKNISCIENFKLLCQQNYFLWSQWQAAPKTGMVPSTCTSKLNITAQRYVPHPHNVKHLSIFQVFYPFPFFPILWTSLISPAGCYNQVMETRSANCVERNYVRWQKCRIWKEMD